MAGGTGLGYVSMPLCGCPLAFGDPGDHESQLRRSRILRFRSYHRPSGSNSSTLRIIIENAARGPELDSPRCCFFPEKTPFICPQKPPSPDPRSPRPGPDKTTNWPRISPRPAVHPRPSLLRRKPAREVSNSPSIADSNRSMPTARRSKPRRGTVPARSASIWA